VTGGTIIVSILEGEIRVKGKAITRVILIIVASLIAVMQLTYWGLYYSGNIGISIEDINFEQRDKLPLFGANYLVNE